MAKKRFLLLQTDSISTDITVTKHESLEEAANALHQKFIDMVSDLANDGIYAEMSTKRASIYADGGGDFYYWQAKEIEGDGRYALLSADSESEIVDAEVFETLEDAKDALRDAVDACTPNEDEDSTFKYDGENASIYTENGEMYYWHVVTLTD